VETFLAQPAASSREKKETRCETRGANEETRYDTCNCPSGAKGRERTRENERERERERGGGGGTARGSERQRGNNNEKAGMKKKKMETGKEGWVVFRVDKKRAMTEIKSSRGEIEMIQSINQKDMRRVAPETRRVRDRRHRDARARPSNHTDDGGRRGRKGHTTRAGATSQPARQGERGGAWLVRACGRGHRKCKVYFKPHRRVRTRVPRGRRPGRRGRYAMGYERDVGARSRTG